MVTGACHHLIGLGTWYSTSGHRHVATRVRWLTKVAGWDLREVNNCTFNILLIVVNLSYCCREEEGEDGGIPKDMGQGPPGGGGLGGPGPGAGGGASLVA